MEQYDAIVVGGGPGGSSAAHYLARSGAKVVLLDKKEFPRAKVCGDGLTPRSVKVLSDLGLDDDMKSYQRVRGLRILGAGRSLEVEFPGVSNFPHHGLVRPRKDLDAAVMQRARDAGAEIRTGTEAAEPVFENGRLAGVKWVRKQKAEGGGVVKADEGTLMAPFTVIADGASSSFGRLLGIKKDPDYPLGLAIRTYYRSDRAGDDFFESWLELRNGNDLLPGYGWIFPVGDGTVNVGVGLLSTYGGWRGVNLNRLQRGFVDILTKTYGITHEDQTEPYQSGRLPMGASVHKPYGDGYILIGDAAGIVNPFTGEGIAYALETGKLGAFLVADALKSGSTTELAAYREALHDIYAAYYRIGRIFVKLISRPALFKAMCQIGLRSHTVMSFVFQIMGNLVEESGGKLADRAFRRALKMAEFQMPDLKDLEIPSAAPSLNGARDNRPAANLAAAPDGADSV